ncbi:hypothetical protein D1Z39_06560, partial [Enterococcus faecalis]|nr:hypothetical protein [Enterococcus faecalis]
INNISNFQIIVNTYFFIKTHKEFHLKTSISKKLFFIKKKVAMIIYYYQNYFLFVFKINKK